MVQQQPRQLVDPMITYRYYLYKHHDLKIVLSHICQPRDYGSNAGRRSSIPVNQPLRPTAFILEQIFIDFST